MIPILFPANATEFSTHGLGALSDSVSCKVKEKYNDAYELTMTYPADGLHFKEIVPRCIIYAIPSPYRLPQPFRVYEIGKPLRGLVTLKAEHISYDLSGVTVKPFSGASASDVLNQIVANSLNSNPFSFYSDIVLAKSCLFDRPYTARQILGGIEGSVLDTYGGEYEFDNFRVYLHAQRGTNSGVTIRYGKNLTGLTEETNSSGSVTGVCPYWADMDGNVVFGSVIALDGEYDFSRVIPLDFSDKFETAPDISALESAAKSYIEANYSAAPLKSCKVSFALLEQTDEYKDFTLLEKCDLCDTVTVLHPDLGVSSTAKITEIETDVLHEKYISVTVGNPRANIAQTISAQKKAVSDMPSKSNIQQAVEGLGKTLLGTTGGAVRLLDTNNDGLPDTLYIADAPDPQKATRVWRFNYEGWGASKNGYNGPFEMGATLTDGLLAQFVTAANLVAGTIRSADGETFFLDLDNGILRMKFKEELEERVSVAEQLANDASDMAKESQKELSDYAEAVKKSLENLQDQIDGAIETWFYDYAPTTSNAPANGWSTEEERNRHLGDLFYIIDNEETGGLVYRWALIDGVYQWQLVEDVELAKALSMAAKAQDTADGKRRNFIVQPYPPYDEGDLWSQDGGDIMVCVNSRESGSYVSRDWKKRNKYTDDTVADQALKEVTTVTERVSSLEVDNKGIRAEVSETKTTAQAAKAAVDNLQVGGRNLALNSGDEKIAITSDSMKMGQFWELSDYGKDILNKVGTEIIISYDAKSDVNGQLIYINLRIGDKATYNASTSRQYATLTNEYERYNFSASIIAEGAGRAWVLLQEAQGGVVGNVYVKNLKVEIGTIDTDWSPAPEDIQNELKDKSDSLQEQIDKNSANIDILSDSITSSVSELKSSVDGVDERVSNVEQTANGVNITVERWKTYGVEKVQTSGKKYTLDDNGLEISDPDSDISNRIDNTGMYVRRGGDDETSENVLEANANGVVARDLTAKNYLIIAHARFESYGDNKERTACFYI